MAEDKHTLTLVDREKLSVSGVSHVASYDDKQIILKTKLGDLVLKGQGLNINSLNLENGTLLVAGLLESIVYTEEQGDRAKGFLRRLLK